MNTMTRDELVGYARAALVESGVADDSDLGLDVLNVAHTVTKIHGDWWSPDDNCGCLIGTLRHRRGGSQPGGVFELAQEWRVGIAFYKLVYADWGRGANMPFQIIDTPEPQTVPERPQEVMA